MIRLTSPSQSDEERCQSCGVKDNTYQVQLLDFFPASFLVIKLWSGRWEVEQQSPRRAHDSEHQADPVAPSPRKSSVQIEFGGYDDIGDVEGNIDGQFCQRKPGSTAHC